MSYLHTPKTTGNVLLDIQNDGTYLTFSTGGTARFRIVLSTGTLQVAGDYDAEVSL